MARRAKKDDVLIDLSDIEITPAAPLQVQYTQIQPQYTVQPQFMQLQPQFTQFQPQYTYSNPYDAQLQQEAMQVRQPAVHMFVVFVCDLRPWPVARGTRPRYFSQGFGRRFPTQFFWCCRVKEA